MPVPKIYETIQKESKEVNDAFNANLKKGQTIQEAVSGLEKNIRGKITLSYKLYGEEDSYYNRMQRKACVDLRFVNEAKYCVLFDSAWNVAHSRSIFSWFIHFRRNWNERKFLKTWKEELERPSNIEAKAKDANNNEPLGLGLNEDKQFDYLDIAEEKYDEKTGITYSQDEKDKENPYEKEVNAFEEEMKKLDEEIQKQAREEYGEEGLEVDNELEENNEIEVFEENQNDIRNDEIKMGK